MMKTREDLSLITIIVAVLNNADMLAHCLRSIADQTYRRKELIVMDGGSTDGTRSVIESFRDHIAWWESKPDRGIYHAWNKALVHGTGEWICFLGSDDYFWNRDVLTDLSPYLKKAADSGIRVVYGRIAKLGADGQVVRMEGKPWEKIRWLMPHGMPLPHPGLMHHRTLFRDHGLFDETFRIAGDYELLLRELRNGRALFAEGVSTVGCRTGGIADARKLLAQREVVRARRKNGLPAVTWLWLAVYIRSLIRTGWGRLKKR